MMLRNVHVGEGRGTSTASTDRKLSRYCFTAVAARRNSWQCISTFVANKPVARNITPQTTMGSVQANDLFKDGHCCDYFVVNMCTQPCTVFSSSVILILIQTRKK